MHWYRKLNKRLTYYRRLNKRFGKDALIFLLQSKFQKNKLVNRKVRRAKYPITLSNFSTDVTTLFQIFFAEEYNVKLDGMPEVIIDCGANIGFSAVYFATKYPHAQIIAIEPDENNFRYLQKNTMPYRNIKCMKNAIWSRRAKMKILDPDNTNWGLQTIEATEGDDSPVEGISLTNVMELFGVAKIDLLKIDIEGAEKELFRFNFEDWLSATKVLAIELHDRLDPEIRNIFQEAVTQFRPKHYQLGENLICDFTHH